MFTGFSLPSVNRPNEHRNQDDRRRPWPTARETGRFTWTSLSSPRAKFHSTLRSASSTSRRLNAATRRPRDGPALRRIELSSPRSSSAIRTRTKRTTFISPLCQSGLGARQQPVPPGSLQTRNRSAKAFDGIVVVSVSRLEIPFQNWKKMKISTMKWNFGS